MQRRRNSDVLLETLALDGRRVLDVGCGDGALTRLMTRQGARVVGIEVEDRQLARAMAAPPAGDEVYVKGVAERLPAADGSVDIVVFFNSLHHVPVAGQPAAIAEAARVLKPGGLLYVSEPVAAGTFFELVRPVDDETAVRAAAYAALKDGARVGLEEVSELTYVHTVRHDGFESFRRRIVAANPERETQFAAKENELRRLFEALATPCDGGFCFDQPTRVNLLRRR